MHQAFTLENVALPKVPSRGSVRFLTKPSLLRKPRLHDLCCIFPEKKRLAVAEAAEHVIKGCHMGRLLTMKNECTICRAVIKTGEQHSRFHPHC